jgi:hypothetical protein
MSRKPERACKQKRSACGTVRLGFSLFVQIPLHPHKRLPHLHRIPQIRHCVILRVVVAQLQQWGELV